MTAVAAQSKRTTRQRRIIERPRLIRRLEAINARTILLVAPAGYGKTTLARQWGRSLSQVIWVSATRSHRDVVTFSEDIAKGVDALGGEAASFIDQYMRARPNPQRAAREIANALAPRIASADVQWLVLDDYHELAESPEVEEMVRVLRERLTCRFLVASRVQPEWATGRGVVHGEVEEVGADELALTPEETTEVLGKRPDLAPLIEQAKGWPAVVTLAAGLDEAERREDAIPSMLHRYVAEELFRSASPELRDALTTLALLPDLGRARITERLGDAAEELVHQMHDLGFLSGDERLEMHPLLREFLLTKLFEKPDAELLIRSAVADALEAEAWDLALELVLRFQTDDLVEPVLERAFKPLVRSGRLGMLGLFTDRIARRPGFPPPGLDVVEAEVALRDGQFQFAIQVADRARKRMPAGHDMHSRATTIVAQSQMFLGQYEDATTSFADALRSATDDTDEVEAIHGLAVSKSFGEHADPSTHIDALAGRRHTTPLTLVRYATAELTRRRFQEGFCGELSLADATRALEHVTDPRARTAFTYTAANALRLRAEYREAQALLARFEADTQSFDLEFAKPFVSWTAASVALGIRRFGDADRLIQSLEDAAAQPGGRIHGPNARVLRARLSLQAGRPVDALARLAGDPTLPPIKSWRGEYAATKALALACTGQYDEARRLATVATCTSGDVEVRTVAVAASSICAIQEDKTDAAVDFLQFASDHGTLDAAVCALRASPLLVDALFAADDETKILLSELWRQSDDFALLRRIGVRTRATRAPNQLLSPRELEVLGLMTAGMRNQEIAESLFIAPSTVKVHVRHILEKLGARTRAEAVARYERASVVN